MKKILIAASVALCFASSSFAVEKAGSTSTTTSTFTSTIGAVSAPAIVGGVAALTVLGGMNSNVKGTITPVVVIDDPADPDPTCNGSDPLVDGVCTGTTSTVTVSGTGTVNVPVTFTYAPTL
jgi:hypothetical protein